MTNSLKIAFFAKSVAYNFLSTRLYNNLPSLITPTTLLFSTIGKALRPDDNNSVASPIVNFSTS